MEIYAGAGCRDLRDGAGKAVGRKGMKYLLYAILAVCLFWGAKICKKKEWNEDVLSFAQTKSFLGFCALIILLHHCAQRTCAPWLAPARIVHGLDAFVYLGYLCVAVFFFCSGYGMYIASRKEGFFKGYYKRILKVLLPAVVIFVMLIGMKIRIGNKVLLFLGTFTLEIYLVHPLFVQLFGFAFVQDRVKPLYHIQNPFLYVAAVTVISIPLAYLLHRAVALMGTNRNGSVQTGGLRNC